jgi:predicted type IV restriction endonuclease
MSTEADARIVINKLLENADWKITNKAQVSTEEPTTDGRADYLLLKPQVTGNNSFSLIKHAIHS